MAELAFDVARNQRKGAKAQRRKENSGLSSPFPKTQDLA
jgi:hypothetical protein